MNTKRALVCGASQGIGAAVAECLARDGYSVILLARSADKLQNVLQGLPGTGHEILAQDLGDIPALQVKIQSQLEKGPITVLVNNSGGPKSGPLLQAQADDFQKAFTEHVLG
jgi:3-oxoacyl-[acyl-carrier protein] reductase